MVNRVESDAWVIISSGADTVRVYFENVKYKPVHKPRKIYHYDGGVNLGLPVYKTYVILSCEGGWVDSNAKIVNYVAYLKTFLTSGSLTVGVLYDGTNYEKMDGTNTTLSMMPKNDLGEIEKIAHGSQTVYYIDKLILEQSG